MTNTPTKGSANNNQTQSKPFEDAFGQLNKFFTTLINAHSNAQGNKDTFNKEMDNVYPGASQRVKEWETKKNAQAQAKAQPAYIYQAAEQKARAPQTDFDAALNINDKNNQPNKDETKPSTAQAENVNLQLAQRGINPGLLNASVEFANAAGWHPENYIGPTGLYDTDENGNLKMLNVDALGNSGGVDPSGIKQSYNIGKNQGKYREAIDADKDGIVTADEETAYLDRLNDLVTDSDYGQFYNHEGGNFRFGDNGLLQNWDYLANDWRDTMYDVNENGDLNLTVSGEQALDSDARNMAIYMMLNRMEGLDYGNKDIYDSWAARQFASGDDADNWWRYTMESSPVAENFNYLRDMDIWGDGGFSYDAYKAMQDNWEKDLYGYDPNYYQALYGDVGLGINSMNKYMNDFDIDGLNPYGSGMMYVDATTVPDDVLDSLGIQPDDNGRIAIDPTTREGIGLANLMAIYGYEGEDINHSLWNQEEMNQLLDIAGLGGLGSYNIKPGEGTNVDDFDIYGAQTRYRRPFRVYDYNEYNQDTGMPAFNLDDLNALLAENYADDNFGFRYLPA